jgi:hypothetical protein
MILQKNVWMTLLSSAVVCVYCHFELFALCCSYTNHFLSDYIGNTVVQKLFERCCEDTKLKMLQRIAPHLAIIGVHKNGTWAAQKIIDTAATDDQMRLICEHIQSYVPPLMLDQFGNYVVQCCLRLGPVHNQFIFDAIVDKTKEIAQGRFGARAIRACLESPHVSMRQKVSPSIPHVSHVLSSLCLPTYLFRNMQPLPLLPTCSIWQEMRMALFW